jgi:hypothetical protein
MPFSPGTPSTTISAPGTRSVNEREMEMALADPTQAKVNATTASGRSNRGLIVVASVIEETAAKVWRETGHFLCQN